MDNRHQFGVKSSPSMRQNSLAACRHFYGRHGIDEEVWPDESCAALVEVLHTENERRTFAVAANAIREEEKARVARELHDELAQALGEELERGQQRRQSARPACAVGHGCSKPIGQPACKTPNPPLSRFSELKRAFREACRGPSRFYARASLKTATARTSC